MRHSDPFFEDLFDAEPRQVIEDQEIRAVAGGNGSEVVKSKVLGWIERRHLNGKDRIDSLLDRLSNHRVHMAFLKELPWMAIIGDEEKAP